MTSKDNRLASRPRAKRRKDDAQPKSTAVVNAPEAPRITFWNTPRLVFAVVALLTLHSALAVLSLVKENPTVDEVVHLPAGVTYWQTGTFRMYHHNPPLVKLIAALPVIASGAVIDYSNSAWIMEPPNKAEIAHEFMRLNANRYFELFTRARLLMPLFSIIGGLVVFFWSKRLYGAGGGVLSLTLWILCPNVLAHTRLVTTDLAATSLGVLATFVFWLYLKRPTMRLATLAGLALGIAQLSKFSLIVLYGLWPILAFVRLATYPEFRQRPKKLIGHSALVLTLSIVVIDAGYGFEGVGIPLGDYEFVCQTLTKPVPPGVRRPSSSDVLLNGAWHFRVNRFQKTILAGIPVPLPKHFMLGFDDQKLEAEGIPNKFFNLNLTGPVADALQGYPVYLDGKLAQKSWWYYYLLTLVYKVPEGTWFLVLASLGILTFSKRACAPWFDEFAVFLVPAFVLLVMSVFTNINLGLRYVLPIFPYVFISSGKLAPWAMGFADSKRRLAAVVFIGFSLSLTAISTALIHPHYLAYFNAVSGGPDRGAEHLIDSNIDWGQDLVNLRRWLEKNAAGERVGLAYFGQIHPRIFNERTEGFDWFLPPARPGSRDEKNDPIPRHMLDPNGARLQAGLYAVSASLVKGLPWRVYDSPYQGYGLKRWAPYQAWFDAFSYFQSLKPIDKVGYSIWIYRVSKEDAARINERVFPES